MKLKLKRLIAIYLDYLFILLLVISFYFVVNCEKIFLSLLVIFMFIFKDLLCNKRSIGKKLMGLKIKFMTDNKLKKSILCLRNLTCIIWPIEIIMILLFNKRIGDVIFKTKIIEEKKSCIKITNKKELNKNFKKIFKDEKLTGYKIFILGRIISSIGMLFFLIIVILDIASYSKILCILDLLLLICGFLLNISGDTYFDDAFEKYLEKQK